MCVDMNVRYIYCHSIFSIRVETPPNTSTSSSGEENSFSHNLFFTFDYKNKSLPECLNSVLSCLLKEMLVKRDV